jgi:hypothetical protein
LDHPRVLAGEAIPALANPNEFAVSHADLDEFAPMSGEKQLIHGGQPAERRDVCIQFQHERSFAQQRSFAPRTCRIGGRAFETRIVKDKPTVGSSRPALS